MGDCLMLKADGGLDVDALTATAGDVLKGMIAGVKGMDDPVVGTLELTGNAAAGQVLNGYTFYSTNAKSKLTGTMANRGAVSQALNAGGSYTIPAGYHNGSGKITANSLSSQTGGTATAGQILSGQTAWVNGSKITGTMANQGAKTSALNCGGTYTIPAGYHNGSGKVTANNLSSQTSATATAGNILSGQTAWVNGSKLTGTMTNRGAVSQLLGINGSYTIPAGYHNGSGKVTQSLATQGGSTTTPGTANKTIVSANRYVTGNIVLAGDTNLKAANIKKNVTIFGVKGTWQGMVDAPLYLFNLGTVANRFKEFIATQNGNPSYIADKTLIASVYSIASNTDYSRSNPTIDLTNYNYVYLKATLAYGVPESTIFSLAVGTDINRLPYNEGVKVESKLMTEKVSTSINGSTLKLDISKLSGYYYIKVGLYQTKTAAVSNNLLYIKQLWLDNV